MGLAGGDGRNAGRADSRGLSLGLGKGESGDRGNEESKQG